MQWMFLWRGLYVNKIREIVIEQGQLQGAWLSWARMLSWWKSTSCELIDQHRGCMHKVKKVEIFHTCTKMMEFSVAQLRRA